MSPQPKSITGPVSVERRDEEDGLIIYEVWDHGPATYHMICRVSEVHCDNAKAEADFIALSMNNSIGALMAIAYALPSTKCTCGADDGDPLDHHDISCPLALPSTTPEGKLDA